MFTQIAENHRAWAGQLKQTTTECWKQCYSALFTGNVARTKFG